MSKAWCVSHLRNLSSFLGEMFWLACISCKFSCRKLPWRPRHFLILRYQIEDWSVWGNTSSLQYHRHVPRCKMSSPQRPLWRLGSKRNGEQRPVKSSTFSECWLIWVQSWFFIIFNISINYQLILIIRSTDNHWFPLSIITFLHWWSMICIWLQYLCIYIVQLQSVAVIIILYQ